MSILLLSITDKKYVGVNSRTGNYYSGSDNVFKGFSKGRITIQKNLILPSGTYYYVINVSNEKTRNKQYSGYLQKYFFTRKVSLLVKRY